MRVTRIRLKDFGIHRDLDLNMDGPVVGFTGPNACGKSTILHALNFGFTNRLPKNNEEYVNRYSGAKNATVSIDFVHHGVRGHIFRQVGATPKCRLQWGDNEPVSGATKMEAELAAILDTNRQIWEAAVFIRQGELKNILAPQEAAREELMIKLLGLGFCKQVSDLAAKQVTFLTSTIADLTAAKDEIAVLTDAANSEIALAKAEIVVSPITVETIRRLERAVLLHGKIQDTGVQIAAKTNSLSGDRQLAEKARTDLLTYTQGEEASGWVEQTLGQAKAISQTELLPLRLAKQNQVLIQTENSTAADLTSRQEKAGRGIRLISAQLSGLLGEMGLTLKVEPEKAKIGAQVARDSAQKLLLHRLKLAEQQELQTKVEWWQSALAGAEEALRGTVQLEQIAQQKVTAALAVAGSAATTLNVLQQASSLVQGCACPICHQDFPSGFDFKDSLQGAEKALETANAAVRVAQDELIGTTKATQVKIKERTTAEAELKALDTLLARMGTLECQEPELSLEPEDYINRCDLVISLLDEQIEKERELSHLNQDLEKSKARLVELTRNAGQQAVGDEQEILGRIQKLEKDAETVRRLFSDSQAAEFRVQRTTTEIQGLEEGASKISLELQALESECKKLIPWSTEEDAAFPFAMLERAREEREKSQRSQGKLSASLAQLQRLEERMGEILKQEEEGSRTRAVISDMRRIQESFSREGLPRTYIRKVFSRLADLTQQSLLEMGADFSVRMDEEQQAAFQFTRHVGEPDWFDQDAFSGGQAVMLGLTFLLANQQLILPNLGFLVLDEPSLHLHETSAEHLRDLLTRFGEILQGTDSQIVVCDHNAILQSGLSIHHQLPDLG